MIRKFYSRFFIAIALFALGWTSSVQAATYRDNRVSFTLSRFTSSILGPKVEPRSGYSLNSGSFTVESFFVTSGQDQDGHIRAGLKKDLDSNGSMTFSIGRKGSEDTANWFNMNIPKWQTTFNKKAGNLNFALLGTLMLELTGPILVSGQDTYTFSNIAIAQGHTGASNNWWFGGQSCAQSSAYIGGNRVACKGVNSSGSEVIFEFFRGSNAANQIQDSSTIQVIPYTNINIDTKAWMDKISDTVTLDQLMMPGSHDAGMSEAHHCHALALQVGVGYVLTQGGSVGTQLLNGARYFDIRVDYDHDKLVTYHRTNSIGCNGQDLKDVLDETVAFLSVYTRETAIIKISHIRSDRDDQANIKNKINNLLTASYSGAMYSNANANINLAGEVVLGSPLKVVL